MQRPCRKAHNINPTVSCTDATRCVRFFFVRPACSLVAYLLPPRRIARRPHGPRALSAACRPHGPSALRTPHEPRALRIACRSHGPRALSARL